MVEAFDAKLFVWSSFLRGGVPHRCYCEAHSLGGIKDMRFGECSTRLFLFKTLPCNLEA